jgi:alanyl aminopeptidase
MIGALGSFSDPALVRRSLLLVLDGTFDFRESFALFFASRELRATRRVPLEFAMEHFDELAVKAPSSVGSAYLSELPRLASVGCSEKDRAEAEAFFGPKMANVTGGPRSLAQTLEGIHLCEAWKNAQQDSVRRFLEKY